MTTEVPQSTTEPSQRLRLWLALGSVYILWGSTYLFIHFMTEQMPPLYMASMRYIVAGTLLYGFARLRGNAPPTRLQWRSTAIIGFVLLTVANGSLTLSLQFIPTGVAALLGGLFPVALLVFNFIGFEKKRPTPLAMLGVAVGAVGLFLLIKPDKFASDASLERNLIGTGLVALGNFAWALGTLLTPRLPQPSQTLASGMQMLMGGFFLLIISLFVEPVHVFSLFDAPAKAIGSMAYLVVFGSIIGFSAYAWLARNAPPALLATYAFVNPVVAVVLGVTFAGEVFSTRSFLGAVIALQGVILLTLGRRTKPKKEHPTPS